MGIVHNLQFLTRLKLTHVILDHLEGNTECSSQSVLQELETGEHDDLSTGILDWIVQQYPASLTDQILGALAGRCMRELTLVNCKNVTVDGIHKALTRCRDLEAMNIGYSDHVAVPELFHRWEPLCNVTAVSLEGNCEMKDSTVQTVLTNLKSLRDLNISFCDNLTDQVFLLDEGKQARREIYGFVDIECSVKLASVEMACTNLTNTAVRHLVTLCGPTLRNVSIGWTEVDCISLLFLSGYGLPAVVDIVLSHASNFSEKEKEALQETLKELEHTRAKYTQSCCVGDHNEFCDIDRYPSIESVADVELPSQNSVFLGNKCELCHYSDVSIPVNKNGTQSSSQQFCCCQSSCTVNGESNSSCECELTVPEFGINQNSTGSCLSGTVGNDLKRENIQEFILIADRNVEDKNFDRKDEKNVVYLTTNDCVDQNNVNTTCCLEKEDMVSDKTVWGSSENMVKLVDDKDITSEYKASEIPSDKLEQKDDNTTEVLDRAEMASENFNREDNLLQCLVCEEVMKNVNICDKNKTACLASDEVSSKHFNRENEDDCSCSSSEMLINSATYQNKNIARSLDNDDTDMENESTTSIQENDAMNGEVESECPKLNIPFGEMNECSNSFQCDHAFCCICQSYGCDCESTKNVVYNNNNNVREQAIAGSMGNTTAVNSSFRLGPQIFKPNLISLNIQKIRMMNVKIANEFLRTIIDANPGLQRLCFEWEELNAEMLAYVCHRLPGLKDVGLLDCKSLGTVAIANLGRVCKDLVTVDLQGVCFFDSVAVLPYTENCSLRELSLAESNVTDLFLKQCVNKSEEGFQLKKLDLSWCEEISEKGLNTFCSCPSTMKDLSLRYLSATDQTLALIAENFQQLKRLVISTVSDINDNAVCLLAENLCHLEEIDISWNSNLTDTSTSALLCHCIHLKKALFGGLKQLTTAPFLPVISDIPKWERCRATWRMKLKEGRILIMPSNKAVEGSDLHVPHRSTSYVANLQTLDLSYCNLVCDEYLEDIVAICRGSLKISDYYGTAVQPSFITKEDGQSWQD